MVERAASQGSLSVGDYLEMEKTASVRHEYVAGEIFATTGATRRHNRIAGNVYRRLADAAGAGSCRVYVETVKLRVEDVFYYPDVMVACEAEPDDPYYEDSPCLVVEVLSPKTETTDRREKLAAYKRIPSLKAYLILDQDRAGRASLPGRRGRLAPRRPGGRRAFLRPVPRNLPVPRGDLPGPLTVGNGLSLPDERREQTRSDLDSVDPARPGTRLGHLFLLCAGDLAASPAAIGA